MFRFFKLVTTTLFLSFLFLPATAQEQAGKTPLSEAVIKAAEALKYT